MGLAKTASNMQAKGNPKPSTSGSNSMARKKKVAGGNKAPWNDRATQS